MYNLIKVENGELTQETVEFIKSLEARKKAFDDKYKEIKEELLKAMEQNGVYKFESDDLRINYIAETQREDFDKKQFKADMPQLYDEYIRYSTVKASVRIAVK